MTTPVSSAVVLPALGKREEVKSSGWSSAPKSDKPSKKVVSREILRRPRDDSENYLSNIIVMPSECQETPDYAQRASRPPMFEGQQHFQLLDRVTVERNRYPEIRHSAHWLDINPHVSNVQRFNDNQKWRNALFFPNGNG